MKDQVLKMWGLIAIVVIFSSQCMAANQASCAKNPCQNKGVCSVKDKSVVCTCEKGYGGGRCEDKPKCLEHKDCPQGVLCITTTTPYTCKNQKHSVWKRSQSAHGSGTKMSVHILLVTFVAVLAVMNLN